MNNIPYSVKELDDLMNACIEFTDDFDEDFATSNVAGREGVSVDIDKVRRMLDWIVETDKQILECTGMGVDNITYFRLGYGARKMMAQGGFKKYINLRKIKNYQEQVRIWAPLCISTLALIVSIFAWQAPKSGSEKIDKLEEHLNALQVRQELTTNTVMTIQEKLDNVTLTE